MELTQQLGLLDDKQMHHKLHNKNSQHEEQL